MSTENTINEAANPACFLAAVMPSCLHMSLKPKWFEMTKAGIKTEDYREINLFWFKRLIQDYKSIAFSHGGYWGFMNDKQVLEYVTSNNPKDNFLFKEFEINIMTLGYPKSTDTDRIIKLKHKGIEIRTGNPEWGAEPNKLYFVIMHGAILA